MSTRLLLLGSSGQVGYELRAQLDGRYQIIAPTSAELDLRDSAALRGMVTEVRPSVILNAAAYTAVDRAEVEKDTAFAINAVAPGVLADVAARIEALLVHYSTDFVFDGAKSSPYSETDQPRPLNVYGASKLEGEKAIAASDARYLIFRTSWVYGLRGANFLLTMLRLLQERDEIRVVDDQIGAPTWAHQIAATTVSVLDSLGTSPAETVGDRAGLYHMTAGSQTSWCGFTRAIADRIAAQGASTAEVHPIRSDEYASRATRPLNSVLSNRKLESTFGVALDPWDAALSACLTGADAKFLLDTATKGSERGRP